LACQDKFFINNPFDVKENDDHALDFDLLFALGGLVLCLSVITQMQLSSPVITQDRNVALLEAI
jgi:hypothetical protein